jgi:hypothetical protein
MLQSSHHDVKTVATPGRITSGFRRSSPALQIVRGAGSPATGHAYAARCARPRRGRSRRAQRPLERRAVIAEYPRSCATTTSRSQDARPGPWPREAAARVAGRGAATDGACGRANPIMPLRSAAGPRDRGDAAWDCVCRAAGRAGCRSFPSRSARARPARETKEDQDQVIEIPESCLREAGDGRAEKADRQRFPA